MFHQSNFLTLVESWPTEHEFLTSAFRRAFAGISEVTATSQYAYMVPALAAAGSKVYDDLALNILVHIESLGSSGPAEVAHLPGFFLAFDDFSARAARMNEALHVVLSTPASRQQWISQLSVGAPVSEEFSFSTPASAFALTWAKKIDSALLPPLWGAVKTEVASFVVPGGVDPHQTRWAQSVLNLKNADVRTLLSRAFFNDTEVGQALADELSFLDPFPLLELKFSFSPNALARYFQASDPWAFRDECAKYRIDDPLVEALVPHWPGSAMEFFVAAQTLTADAS